MIVVKTEMVQCKEPGCNNEFRWNGYGIKPKRCNHCENLRRFEKQREYSERANERKRHKLKMAKNSGKQKPDNGKKQKRTCWEDKPTNYLINYVQYQIVNPYIRERDKALYKNKCISCADENIDEAGHRFPVSSHPGMRFMVNNIHGQGHNCNCHLHGNTEEFDKGLKQRFGDDYCNELHFTAQLYQHGHLKLMRHELIEIGRTYKHLLDNRIWVLHQKAFDNYLNILSGNI